MTSDIELIADMLRRLALRPEPAYRSKGDTSPVSVETAAMYAHITECINSLRYVPHHKFEMDRLKDAIYAWDNYVEHMPKP